MNRIPAGMYIPGKSFLHRLDSFVKLIGFLLFFAAVIAAGNVLGYLLFVPLLILLIKLSKITPNLIFGPVRRIFMFYVVIFLMNSFFHESDNPLWEWTIFRLSLEGIVQGAHVVLRLIIIIIAGTIFTAVTSPMEITSALKRLFRPLKYIKIPVDIISLIISVAIQFIPVLSEEIEMIRMAQIARGARFNSRNLREKAASMLPIIIPVFLGAFKRADELALAMEARGYRTESCRKGLSSGTKILRRSS